MTICYVTARLSGSWDLQTWLTKLVHNKTAAGGAQNPPLWVSVRFPTVHHSLSKRYVVSYGSKQIEVIPLGQKVHENKNSPLEIISHHYGSQQAKV